MPKAKIDHDEIKTLTDLWVAAQRRQSVYVPGNQVGILGPKPAAFIMNLTGHQIMRMIERGLKVYRPAPSPWARRAQNAAKLISERAAANVAKKAGTTEIPW